MDKKIVLIGAGSSSFGPATLADISLSKILYGSTIVLHDINKEKLDIIYELVVKENEIIGNKFNIEQTTDRKTAIKNADFIICSIENGDRFKLRWQDNRISRKFGSTEMMGENGGCGGFFHSARQIPEVLKIAKDVFKENPHAFFINYSNPMSRICLAIKREVPELKFVGLCHQIGLILGDLPYIIDDSLQEKKIKQLSFFEKNSLYKDVLKDIRITVGGLNHFAFILKIINVKTGKNLMPIFNERCKDYYKDKWHRFKYADLTFELYRRFGWFCYAGDNHIEYVQWAKDYLKYEDIQDWIAKMEQGGKAINDRILRYYKRLKKGKYPRKGMLSKIPSNERAVPIIEAIIEDRNSYEIAVNIPNNDIIKNLPEDLVIECSATVNKEGIHGIKLGNLPKNIAAILRIEASIQDVCVEAILKKSKDLAISCLAMDVNCGSFNKAEMIFNEMIKLQKNYLPHFK
ncbi:MAG: family 4 glycosyl hydrolase [Promethearchaeota archaeon]